jgi:hypothetical protein
MGRAVLIQAGFAVVSVEPDGRDVVTLSSGTVKQPTFTAPGSAGALTFQLVALSATATASSQNTSTGQPAAKAIDGMIGGYPGVSTAEWAADGGGAGSWLS